MPEIHSLSKCARTAQSVPSLKPGTTTTKQTWTLESIEQQILNRNNRYKCITMNCDKFQKGKEAIKYI